MNDRIRIIIFIFALSIPRGIYGQTQDSVVLTTYLPRAVGLYHRIETDSLIIGRNGTGYLQFVGFDNTAGILGYGNFGGANSPRFETSDRLIFRHRDARLSTTRNRVLLESREIYIGDDTNYDQTKVFINVPFRLRADRPYLYFRQWWQFNNRYTRLYVDTNGSIARFRIQPRNSGLGPRAVRFDCGVPNNEPALVIYNGAQERFKVLGDGSVYINGTQEHDIAEFVQTEQRLEAGDVVIIGEGGVLTRTRKAYDHKVAGIISTSPTIVMGEEGKGKKLLALSGVVPCKAEAIKEEIRPGDLLVTSSVSGYARKAEKVLSGTILGKALEGLKQGEKGMIMVLVGLE